MANRGHFLRVNEHLGPLDYLASPNGQYFALMQRDGNLVVYPGTPEAPGEGLWAYSDFPREDGDYFTVMQSDGNLCVYRGTGPNDNRGGIWCTRPNALEERGDYVVVMQDDGNLCVYVSPPSPENYRWGWMELKQDGKEWWEKAGHFFEDIPSQIDGAWHTTSDSITSVAEGARQAGVEVGESFIAGAEATQAALETGAEATRQGLVEMQHYINQHACSIAIGSALTAAVTTVMSGGAGVPLMAVIDTAARTGDQVALKSSMGAVAHLLAGPVSQIPIPGFDESRDEIETALAFLLVKAVTKKPPTGVVTPGFVIGLVLYGLTEFICSGNLPGGYSVWKGAQAEIPQG